MTTKPGDAPMSMWPDRWSLIVFTITLAMLLVLAYFTQR